MANYANPNTLVTTDWVDEHKGDGNVVVAEVDTNTAAYDEGHIPGAVGWNWQTQLCDTVRRDVIPRADLEKLLGSSGIDNNTTIILYGDNNNWFACWAYWQLKIFGAKDVRIMDGGRKKWLAEGRDLSTDAPDITETRFEASGPDYSTRAFLKETTAASEDVDGSALVDVRSPDEYTGKILAPAGLNETCQRGGHIPGGRNIGWGKNCNEDGTFKSFDELSALYTSQGVTPDKTVVAYCRIGERSSLSWFVLKELLGYPNVINYDGSWTEWGNLVGVPVVRGDALR
jgi:thiosulfate/3-mercaptopyruvate sulfurtransferase